jgi:glutamyl-tRNA reductase
MNETPPIRLLLVGLNHKTAPLEVRETLAFDEGSAVAALTALRAQFPAAEAVLLSTCNRVELYLARPLRGEPSIDSAADFLAAQHKLDPAVVRGHLYHHEDRAAVEHLFAVASSLDSMVVGETQILAQVKQAYQLAIQQGAVGFAPDGASLLHPLFQRAIAAAKNVHDSTELSSGRLSIASVAIDLAKGVFDRFEDKSVLCIGAGKMSRLMLRHLRDLSPGKLVITNRSFGNAETLAREFNAEAIAFTQLSDLLVDADIVLTSTGASEPIITEAMFKSLLKKRRYRPVVLIDIAVPRDVEKSVGELPNVYLYNIDDLQDVAAANRSKRDAQVSQSAAILKTHVDEFTSWLAARDVGPIVKALYEQAGGMAKAELDALFSKLQTLSPEDKAAIEKMAHRLTQKLLHTPVTRITQDTAETARPFLISAIKKLFGI